LVTSVSQRNFGIQLYCKQDYERTKENDTHRGCILNIDVIATKGRETTVKLSIKPAVKKTVNVQKKRTNILRVV